MHLFIRSKIFTTAILIGAVSFARASVDIGLAPNAQGSYDVRLYPSEAFDGVISGLVFTIGVNDGMLNDVQLSQSAALSTVVPIARSGDVRLEGGVRYHVFYAVGMVRLTDQGEGWQADMGYTIATVATSDAASLWIAEDDWVRRKRNNAAYYISLNGLESTGEVRQEAIIPLNVIPELTLSPTPFVSGPVTLTWNGMGNGPFNVIILDAGGRSVFATTIPVGQSKGGQVLNGIPELAAGGYVVQVSTPERTASIKLSVGQGASGR